MDSASARRRSPGDGATSQRLWLVVTALGVVYVVWGSTYLAIRIVVEEAPPLTSMGLRFFAAGAVLALVLSVRHGLSRFAVGPRELLGCAFLGLMLPTLGNGLVAVGERMGAPSGVTALLIAISPLWIVLLRRAGGDRPARLTLLGVLIGFAGLALLVLAGRDQGADHELPLAAAGVILFASSCWATGSYLQPRLWLPRDVFVTAVYEMLFGGLMLIVLGSLAGERFSGDYGSRTWLALGYLALFGSLIAYTSYVWLLANAPISLVATFAYVNPVVAVFLGWLILSEPVTGPVLLGGGIVVVGVVVVITSERPRKQPMAGAVPAGVTGPEAR